MKTPEDEEFERIERESGWRKRQIQEDDEEDIKKWYGFDDCVIGVASIWRDQGIYEVLVYSGDKMLEWLMERDGIDDEEAREFISFNIEGAYIGVTTPVIVWIDEEWDNR